MTEALPTACSLEATELGRRLQEIASIGGESLLGRLVEDEARVLRFRSDPQTARRLERIVVAEAKCCPFLQLDLDEEGEELVLRIAAPADGLLVADELARAFGEPR